MNNYSPDDAVAEAEHWLWSGNASQTSNEACADERRLIEIVCAYYAARGKDYTPREIDAFGLAGQGEDDIFVIVGSISLPCDACPGGTEHLVSVTDLYVRLGQGYQRLPGKSAVLLIDIEAKARKEAANFLEEVADDLPVDVPLMQVHRPPAVASPRFSRWSWARALSDVFATTVLWLLDFCRQARRLQKSLNTPGGGNGK